MDAFLNTRIPIPAGWAISQPRMVHGPLALTMAGQGVGASPPASLVSFQIPAGMRYFVSGFVVLNSDDPGFATAGAYLTLNGQAAMVDYSPRRMNGVEVPVYQDFGAGLLEVVGVNTSGQYSTDGIDVYARASIFGVLLRPDRKRRS